MPRKEIFPRQRAGDLIRAQYLNDVASAASDASSLGAAQSNNVDVLINGAGRFYRTRDDLTDIRNGRIAGSDGCNVYDVQFVQATFPTDDPCGASGSGSGSSGSGSGSGAGSCGDPTDVITETDTKEAPVKAAARTLWSLELNDKVTVAQIEGRWFIIAVHGPMVEAEVLVDWRCVTCDDGSEVAQTKTGTLCLPPGSKFTENDWPDDPCGDSGSGSGSGS